MNTLATAIAATFSRRGMALPTDVPIGLSDEFANDASRKALWQAFLNKNEMVNIALADVVAQLRTKLQSALSQAASIATSFVE